MKLGMRIFAWVSVALGVSCLTSCQHTLVKPNSMPVYYSDSGFVNLLPTTAMPGTIDEAQHLEGTFRKMKSPGNSLADTSTTTFSGDVWVRANDTILSVVFFSGFGTTIAELTYAKDSVSFVSSVIDVEKMKAEYVIADLQTCFYPFEALKNNFEQSGFTFTEKRLSDESQDFERELSENGKTILRVTRKASEIDLVNELRQYKYHINLGSE
jgi:hypothetical protein